MSQAMTTLVAGSWRGPGIAVVEIEQQAHAGLLDAGGELDGVREVAVPGARVAARSGRVDEGSQANVVEAVVLQDGEQAAAGAGGAAGGGAVHVLELRPAVFRLLHARDVRPDDEGRHVAVSYTHLTLPTNREVETSV